MPKSSAPSQHRRAPSAPATRATPTAPASPADVARDTADAMYRAALECCHQHDRVSRIAAKSAVDAEVLAAQKLCALCDATLRALADAYEHNAAVARPHETADGWMRCANSLWLASREYTRHSRACDAESKALKQHDRERLGELHTEYEFEASALLGLKHAAEDYRKCRPTAA